MKTISQWLLVGGVLAVAVACQPQKGKEGQNGGCRTSMEKPIQKSGVVENKAVTSGQPVQEKKPTVSLEPKATEVEKTQVAEKPAPVPTQAPVSTPAPTAAAETKTEPSKNATTLNQVKAVAETPAVPAAPASK
ncbi:MAG: hypothetical protein FJZ64_03110 [Chlamydiae bacterium]|nr:hypothetical protein [Chlamydiota bacterium]